MNLAGRFELVLLLIAASLALTLAARRLRLPNAAALILGGIGLALIPGMPDIELDPELTLILFLPPLLLVSAYLTNWRDFQRDLRIILQLAVGAVLFTTLVVGWITHLVMPGLPWAVCFAGLAALLGHGRSIWLNFTGGKSAATGLGVLLAMSWPVGLGAAAIFGALLAVFRRVSLGSILAALTAVVLVCALQ